MKKDKLIQLIHDDWLKIIIWIILTNILENITIHYGKSLSTSQYRNLRANWKLTGAYRVLNHIMGFNHLKYWETTDNWSILVGRWLFFQELDYG